MIAIRIIFLECRENYLEQHLLYISPLTATITNIQVTDHEKFPYIYDVQPIKRNYVFDFVTGSPTIRIYSRKNYQCAIGTQIQILAPIKPRKNVSFEKYKKKIGITATLFDPKITLIDNLKNDRLIPTKEALFEKIAQKMQPETAVFFSTLFLGKNSHQTTFIDMKNNCNYWGISHMLARSGLHLVIFIALFSFFLSYIPLYFRYKHCLIIGLLLLYAYLSWSSISFIRALLCMIIYHASAYSHIKISLLQALWATGILIIFINPYQSFFADFQLSFILTAALASYSFVTKSRNH